MSEMIMVLPKEEIMNIPQAVVLHEGIIDRYLQNKLSQGVSQVTVQQYKLSLMKLYVWLSEDKEVTLERLKEWRESMELYGYSKVTVQSHVKVINDFFRSIGYPNLCIPKPARLDLRGQTFGYITAIAPTEKRNRSEIVWKCVCRCGKEIEVSGTLLVKGKTRSCGCVKTEILKFSNRYVEGTSLRQSLENKPVSIRSASGYTGVVPKRDKWQAMITYKGKLYNLGTYTDMEEAVKARAKAKELVIEDAEKLYQKYDYYYRKKPVRPEEPIKQIAEKTLTSHVPVRRSDNTSGYTGIVSKEGKWVARISYKGKRYILGSYEKLEEAVAIRNQAEQYVKEENLNQLEMICTNRKEKK